MSEENPYHVQRRKESEELKRLVTAIGAALGPQWKLKPQPERDHPTASEDLTDGEGHAIHFNGSWYEGKLHISGHYPRDEHSSDYGRDAVSYNVELPRIKCSTNRPPEAIAKDIQRRFLPAYLEIFNKALERQKATNQHYDTCAANASRLQRAAGTGDIRGEKRDTFHYATPGYDMYGDFRCHSDGDVTIDLRGVSVDVAEAIIKMMLKK